MLRERADRVADLVADALGLDETQRGEFVIRACGNDAELRAELESLLDCAAPARQFIEEPVFRLDSNFPGATPPGSLAAGQMLGGCRIVSLLGEGGMGEVYLAEDLKLGRRVAIKLVKRGLSAANLRQFQREERILAGLNDPRIAQLYGSAVTPEGLPYFVMEYVEGHDLDDYCREQNLDLRARLELFRKICGAVNFAHQRLVIHRDLKPANIRVTSMGDPKLLDFGIAKVLEPEVEERAAVTVTIAPAMTPQYASPEQLRGERMTTASDIYSLGVVLYELLTERRPYETKGRGPAETARFIVEQPPLRPSTAAPGRRRQLTGDLDKIVLRALRPEPERRYGSAAELADDLRRHLEGRPVLARPETFRYVTAKFVRRHRLGVAAATLALLALLAGITAIAWSARAARVERAKAVSVSAFLERVLNFSNPLESGRGARETTVGEMLDAAAQRLETERSSMPAEARAEVLKIISDSYGAQGRYDLHDRYLAEYVQVQAALPGATPGELLRASAARAGLLFNSGKPAEAERLYREVLPQLRAAHQRGEVAVSAFAAALNGFAYLRRTQGDSREAEQYFRETLALAPQLGPESRYVIGMTRSTLASTLADGGRFNEAVAAAREAIADYRASQTTGTPDFGFSLTVLGGFLTDRGDLEEAGQILRQGEAILRQRLDPTHLWLGDNLRNQAILLVEMEKFAEAETYAAEACRIYRHSFGPHYDHYPTARIALGTALARTGRIQEGEAILREALQQRIESLPAGHFWIALARGALGECLAREGRREEAATLLLEARAGLTARLGPEDPRTRKAARRVELFQGAPPKPES